MLIRQRERVWRRKIKVFKKRFAKTSANIIYDPFDTSYVVVRGNDECDQCFKQRLAQHTQAASVRDAFAQKRIGAKAALQHLVVALQIKIPDKSVRVLLLNPVKSQPVAALFCVNFFSERNTKIAAAARFEAKRLTRVKALRQGKSF